MIDTAKYVCDCGSVLEEIAAERRRQIEREGYTPEHDDAHDDGAISAWLRLAMLEGIDPL